jgi:hypothetical protein
VVSLKIWQLNYTNLVIRKLIERGIVKTTKAKKNNRQKKEPVVWDILENVIKRTSYFTECSYCTD